MDSPGCSDDRSVCGLGRCIKRIVLLRARQPRLEGHLRARSSGSQFRMAGAARSDTARCGPQFAPYSARPVSRRGSWPRRCFGSRARQRRGRHSTRPRRGGLSDRSRRAPYACDVSRPRCGESAGAYRLGGCRAAESSRRDHFTIDGTGGAVGWAFIESCCSPDRAERARRNGKERRVAASIFRYCSHTIRSLSGCVGAERIQCAAASPCYGSDARLPLRIEE